MSAASNPWFRLWVDMPNDPKWRTIARASGQAIAEVISVYLHVLTNASNATERGRTQSVCAEDIASALDIRTEQVDAILLAMQGRVLDGDRVKGWEKRQPGREDGAAERAKAWRDAKKQQKQGENTPSPPKPNATERNRTQANASESQEERREEESRGDTEDTNTACACEPAEFVEPGEFDRQRQKVGAACLAMKAQGLGSVNASHPDLAELVKAGVGADWFADGARTAVTKGKGFAYALGVVKGQWAESQSAAASVVMLPAGLAKNAIESFSERDRRKKREDWEAMTGRQWDEADGGRTGPARPAEMAGEVVDVFPENARISQ